VKERMGGRVPRTRSSAGRARRSEPLKANAGPYRARTEARLAIDLIAEAT
jgi:hypothetical protein